ncbi:hypothetical protein, partial [Streptomyces venezuelae]
PLRAFLRALPFGVSFVLAFPTLSDSFVSDFLGAFPVPAPAFRLSRFPFRRLRLYQKFSAGLTGFGFRIIGGGFSH